jgi:hypothetical protein
MLRKFSFWIAAISLVIGTAAYAIEIHGLHSQSGTKWVGVNPAAALCLIAFVVGVISYWITSRPRSIAIVLLTVLVLSAGEILRGGPW